MQINIEKRLALFILGVMFLLTGTLVYAVGTNNPTVFGHSAGELDLSGSIEVYDCYYKNTDPDGNTGNNWFTDTCNSGDVMIGLYHKYHIPTAYGYWVTKLRCCKIRLS